MSHARISPAKKQEPHKHIQNKGAAAPIFMDFLIQPATPQFHLPSDSNETSGGSLPLIQQNLC